MSDKIRKYVLPNLPYLFVFWFFSKIGTAYRIAPGTDFGTKLMGMLDTFPKAFETYWPGLGGIDLLVGLAGAAGVYLLIQSKIRKAKKFRRDAEYGTARFGTKEDIKPFVDPKFQNNVILTGTEFLTMNTRPKINAVFLLIFLCFAENFIAEISIVRQLFDYRLPSGPHSCSFVLIHICKVVVALCLQQHGDGHIIQQSVAKLRCSIAAHSLAGQVLPL